MMRPWSDVANPIDAVTALVDDAVTAAHVVAGPLVTVDPDEAVEDALSALRAQDFDVAPVSGDPITHYVATDELVAAAGGSIEDVAVPIPASLCVEISLPLSLLLRRLRAREFAFVLEDGEVQHIVTRADLQAPAIGVVILSYLTLIESGLRRLVVPRLGDSLVDRLSDERRAVVEALYKKKRTKNVATGLEDCLYFSDWLALAIETDLPALLGYRSRRAFSKDVGSFTDVRNELSHGGTILDGASSPERALERVERIRRFAESLWEQVGAVPVEVDRYSGATIRLPRGGRVLAGPPPLATLPSDGVHHVITAFNPHGLQRSRTENRRANGELRDLLRRRGHKPRLVIGESEDGQWREELFLVGGLSRRSATELGSHFGQEVVVELDATTLTVVRCTDGRVLRVSDRASAPTQSP